MILDSCMVVVESYIADHIPCMQCGFNREFSGMLCALRLYTAIEFTADEQSLSFNHGAGGT